MAIQTTSGRFSAERWGLPLAIIPTLGVLGGAGRPWLIANTTPSEPRGLYVRASTQPAVGRLVAFPTPPAARPYAGHTPLLKAVAAVAGDVVCTTSGRLTINAQDRAPIAGFDRHGRRLPRWVGCRVMRDGELFVFSARVPNSLDSRYFGPISTRQILGVYAPIPLLTEAR